MTATQLLAIAPGPSPTQARGMSIPGTVSAPSTAAAHQAAHQAARRQVDWFDERPSFRLPRMTQAAQKLSFTGKELRFLARVVYAEASGQARTPDAAERLREKLAIIHVCHFRLGRKGHPSSTDVADSFDKALQVPGQFESVFKDHKKLGQSTAQACVSLIPAECKDLKARVAAVRPFPKEGPDWETCPFDKFLAANGRKRWTAIGGNEFSLFASMTQAMAQEQKAAKP